MNVPSYEQLLAENERLRKEGRKDYEGMREFQQKYIAADQELRKLRAELDALKAQEPVGIVWRTDNGHLHGSCSCSMVSGTPLYARPLPGAQTQPAPRVPTSLLVAIADLVAQMEIVSRVGFIDTPDDKDSCAAFCVAEGTWLELMSCVESLASALAAAPKPEVK